MRKIRNQRGALTVPHLHDSIKSKRCTRIGLLEIVKLLEFGYSNMVDKRLALGQGREGIKNSRERTRVRIQQTCFAESGPHRLVTS